MLKLNTACFLFLITQGLSVFSQSCANYTVTRTTGITYTTIVGSGANSFIWRNTSGGATNDDNRSISTPIGFDFWYLGVRYTSFSASLNGFIDFSSSTNVGTAGAAYGPLNGNEFSVGGTGGTMLALAPMYNDLWPNSAGTSPIANSVIYLTSGTAPNRVLTVEWVAVEIYKGAPYWTSPPNLNFQVKIYETSGLIEFIYGDMTIGNATHNYAVGINNTWTPAAAPTASLHLTQQTANTASFSFTPQNALTTYPTSSTQLAFTPPPPSAAPSALSFSAIGQTSMELYWNDNAGNELGYVILNSSDGINFSFVSQLAANSVSAAVSGLSSGTNYQWRVHAVTEGDLGSAATGTQATAASGTIISAATGNWNTPATWNCTCVPTAADYVTIANTHNVTLDTDGACLTLTVGQGTSGQLTLGNNATSRSLTVSGNLVIQSGATIINGASNATHQMTVTGNVVNNGTLNLSASANRLCNITFNKNGTQSITGTGATTFFNRITMAMGNSVNNVLDISSSSFSVRPTNFLTLTSGTFKLSSPMAATLTPFTGATTFSTNNAMWLNNSNTVLLFGNSITSYGNIRVSAGTFSVGNANNENLIVDGGNIIIDGGILNVAGRFARLGLTSRINFSLSAGSVTVGTVGSSTANEAIFRLDENGSSFSMSGGSLTLRRSGASNLGLVNTSTTNVSVTGGTLFLGDASTPASQTITINSNVPIQNLDLNSSVAVTASLLTNSLTVNNNLSINSGTLISNNLNINIKGNWLNNGLFTAGTASVIFNGTATQSLSGVSTTTFANLSIVNSSTAGVVCNAPISVSASLNLSSGILTTDATNIISLGTSAGSSAGSNGSHINGPMEKSGTSAFVFPLGKGGRWARLGIGAPSSSTTFRAEYFDSPFTNSTSMASTPTPALNNVSQQEHWQLDRTVGSGDAQVTLYWENSTFSGINDCSTTDLRVAHWNSGSSVWENNNDLVSTSGACTGATPGSVTTSLQVTSFSPFTFGSLSPLINPLPVELLKFDAVLLPNGTVKTDWKTASEFKNDFYTVQKSIDGINFEDVGRVKGSGTTHALHSYSLVDEKPYSGISYYRLKQTDTDLNFSYSSLVSVYVTDSFDAVIYPNPNDGSILYYTTNLQLANTFLLIITDALGKECLSQNIVNNHVSGNYSGNIILNKQLSSGIYYLTFYAGDQSLRKKLIIKD